MKNKFLITRSSMNGKIERVFVTSQEIRKRKKFLQVACLKAVPKKGNLLKTKAKSAVKKYFKEHVV